MKIGRMLWWVTLPVTLLAVGLVALLLWIVGRNRMDRWERWLREEIHP